jgi:hypothetical protein
MLVSIPVPREVTLMLRWLPILALLFFSHPAFAQQPEPEQPQADPLRPQRVAERDAWAKLGTRLQAEEDPRSQLLAAWALFHAYDVDCFAIMEGDPSALLKSYAQRCEEWRKGLRGKLDSNILFDLADAELAALADDIEANRLQNLKPEETKELPTWNEKFETFQTARVTALHERGKLIVKAYREGEVDALRCCVALLERQIAERQLLEHQELAAEAEAAPKFAAQRKTLLQRQQTEWKTMNDLLMAEKERASARAELGAKVCFLHQRTINLLQARSKADEVRGTESEVQAAREPAAELTRRLFTAYRDLHRTAAELHGDGKLTVDQLARLDDLRMYTTIWTDPALDAADVAADVVEVAEMWRKLHEALAKSSPEGRDTQIARAKRQASEIVRLEREQ